MLEKLSDWMIGGDYHYMTTWHCLNGDNFMSFIIIGLCSLITVGYCLIAYHWYASLRLLKHGLPRKSLFDLVNIFLFCGINGYLFAVVKFWWPAWRLQAIFLAILAFFTLRYACNTKKLKAIFQELQEPSDLIEELEKKEKEHSDMVHTIDDFVKPNIEEASDKIFWGIDENQELMPKKEQEIKTNIIMAEAGLNQALKKSKKDNK